MDIMWFIIVFVVLIAIFLVVLIISDSFLLQKVLQNMENKAVTDSLQGIDASLSSLPGSSESGLNVLIDKFSGMTSGLGSLSSELRIISESTKASLAKLNSKMAAVKNVLMADPEATLTNECMLSEQCLLSYLKRKFYFTGVTSAGNVVTANQGSATTESILPTKRVYFSDGNYYMNFYMPAGTESELLFIHVMSGWSVNVCIPRTDMALDLKANYNTITAFIYKDNKWRFIRTFNATMFN